MSAPHDPVLAMTIIDHIIVLIGRLYFMTILEGRTRPSHGRRLKDIQAMTNITDAQQQAAVEVLDIIREDKAKMSWRIDGLRRALRESNDDNVLRFVDVPHLEGYDTLDVFAVPLIGYISRQLMHKSAWDNFNQFEGALKGMLIPYTRAVNLAIILRVYDEQGVMFNKFPKADYESLVAQVGSIYAPNLETSDTVINSITMRAAKPPRAPQRTAVKQPPRPIEPIAVRRIEHPVPANAPSPRRATQNAAPVRGRARADRYFMEESDDDDTLDLNNSDEYVPGKKRPNKKRPVAKRISVVDTEYESSARDLGEELLETPTLTREFMNGVNPMPNPPQMVAKPMPSVSQLIASCNAVPKGIQYSVTTDCIVGVARNRCFKYGDYMAIPTDGTSATVRFTKIIDSAVAIKDVDVSEQLGEHYLIPKNQLIQVYNIVSICPSVDLNNIPKVVIG